MEAFILQERVLTAQHMTKRDHKDLKYIKKYDLPTPPHPTHPHSKENAKRKYKVKRSPHFEPNKVKNLLSSLTDNIERTSYQ